MSLRKPSSSWDQQNCPKGVIYAGELSGANVGEYLAFKRRNTGKLVLGEVRQVYHFGNVTTLNYIPYLSGNEEMSEEVLAQADLVYAFTSDGMDEAWALRGGFGYTLTNIAGD